MNLVIYKLKGKIITGIITLAITGFISAVASAQLPEEKRDISQMEALPQEQNQLEVTYDDEIKENEIPENILLSVKDNYDNYKIDTAHRGSDGSYRVSLKQKDESIHVFYSAGGEFLRIEQDTEDASINDDWR